MRMTQRSAVHRWPVAAPIKGVAAALRSGLHTIETETILRQNTDYTYIAIQRTQTDRQYSDTD